MNFIGRFLWLILTIAAISLAMVFAVSNTQQVTLQFWPFTGQLEIAAWAVSYTHLTLPTTPYV